MSVVGNALSEIGDSIVFTIDVPIVGLDSITGYTEDVANETGSRFFTREFRYSLDGGVNWSDKLDLTVPNLTAIPVEPWYDVSFEYTYTRAGTDTSGVLLFNSVQINGVYVVQTCGQTFENSVFSYFFSSCHVDPVKIWCINVLDKIYKPGIVSKSLTRGDNQNKNQEDRDFIDFWRSITCYFALLVAYAREFETFQTNQQLMVKYLRNRDLHVCESQSLSDLNYLMRNYYDEMRQRGTYMIAKKKGEILHGSTAKPVDGELLRLICFDVQCDEFLFAVQEFDTAGWVVDGWSPLWQGITHQAQLTKIYEVEKDFIDLVNYPLVDGTYCSIVADGSKQVLSINSVPNGQSDGIGFSGSPDFDFATVVEKNLSYELSFFIRQVDSNAPFSVRLYGYDAADNPVDIREVKSSALMPVTNDAIVQQTMADSTDYYFVRVIVFPANHVYVTDAEITTPAIGVGQNLKMTDSVCKIIPEIVLDNNTGADSGEIRIWDMKFAPLKTEYSTGFIGISNFVQTWTKNNNGSLTQDQLEEIITYKLLPVRCTLKNNVL